MSRIRKVLLWHWRNRTCGIFQETVLHRSHNISLQIFTFYVLFIILHWYLFNNHQFFYHSYKSLSHFVLLFLCSFCFQGRAFLCKAKKKKKKTYCLISSFLNPLKGSAFLAFSLFYLYSSTLKLSIPNLFHSTSLWMSCFPDSLGGKKLVYI